MLLLSGDVDQDGPASCSKHDRRRQGSGSPGYRSAKLFGSARAAGRCRSSQLVIGCRRIQQGLSQYWRSDSRCQFTEAARLLAVLCGRVGQSGGVPIGHDFLPETQSTEHGGGNSAEAKRVEQGFHECDPPRSVSSDVSVGLSVGCPARGRL